MVSDSFKKAINDIIRRDKILAVMVEVLIALLIVSLVFNVKQAQTYANYKKTSETQYEELKQKYIEQSNDIELAFNIINSYKETCEKYEYCVNDLETMVIELMDYLKFEK